MCFRQPPWWLLDLIILTQYRRIYVNATKDSRIVYHDDIKTGYLYTTLPNNRTQTVSKANIMLTNTITFICGQSKSRITNATVRTATDTTMFTTTIVDGTASCAIPQHKTMYFKQHVQIYSISSGCTV